MTEFAVWAPERTGVEIEFGDHRVVMEEGEGWWRAEVPQAVAGTRYRFAVDGGEPVPDPRSGWQPEGIDGPSAVVDHDAHPWRDQAWRGRPLSSAVIYELHVGTFSPQGTFDGAIDHLDHLAALGIGAIELLPVAECSGERGWGYDGVLLWAPHHAYGGPGGLKRLVDAAHERGMAVIGDVVYNHLGPAGNHLAKFGPYFTDRYRTPWGDAVNYDDAGADGVRDFVIGNALMWLRHYHFDGLRLDAVHAIFDQQATHILEALADEVGRLSEELGRPLWLIAESDLNDPRLVRSGEAGGYGLTATWSDDFHHALHVALTGERSGYYRDFDGLPALARAFEDIYVFAGDYSPSRRRRHGRRIGDLPPSRFVGYLQNHDQIGNRAVGERSAALMTVDRLMVGAALVLCGPWVPMLFQGEEWGASTPWLYFTDHQDPDLGRAVAEGRRREFAGFGWAPEDIPDPQDRATFERSVLDWSELAGEDHQRLLRWHGALIALRPRLAGSPTKATYQLVGASQSEEGQTFDASRTGWIRVDRGPMAVIVALGAPVILPVGERRHIVLASSDGVQLDDEVLHLPSDAVAILA